MSSSQTAETLAVPPGDKLRVGLAAVVAVAAVVGYYYLKYYFRPQETWMAWLSLGAGLVLAAALFFMSQSGKALIDFGRSAIDEGKKVVWPDRKTTLQMTLVVFVMVTILGLFLFLLDKGIEWVVYDLILRWN